MKYLKILFSTMLVALLCLADSDAKVVYVKATAPAGGNGNSWGAACRHLQDALDFTVAGDEVWVAAGTYYPDLGAAVTTGDRTATFSLKQNVKLYGGFTGGETNLIQRNPAVNITTLSGEISTEKLYWSLHVVTPAGNATLDGFTVTKGNANGDTSPYNAGAGIYAPATNAILTVANCKFAGNTASSTEQSSAGGAIYAASSVTATNCTFTGNMARSGGAIFSITSSSAASVTATDCTFIDNGATAGGAIYSNVNSSYSYVTASNCTFTGNTAISGGAIYSNYRYVTANNCTFSNNTASSTLAKGGAIYSRLAPVTTTNCTFSNNTASGSQGGAIYSDTGSSVTAAYCSFAGNTATVTGGAIYANSSVNAKNCAFTGNTARVGGAIYSNYTSYYVTTTNCVFTGNVASSSGGAIYSNSPAGPIAVTATNCTFSNNTAPFGGAISSDSYFLTATNCLFTGNTASSSGGAIYADDSSASVTVTNCTLVDNLARGTGKKGGAIYAPGIVKIFNNVFWHTLPEAQDNLIYITSTGSIRNSDSGFPSPLNQARNLIKTGVSAITADAGAVISLGTTSVTMPSGDPLFENAGNPVGADGIWKTADDGLQLRAFSPAVDVGLSMFLPADTYDIDSDGNTTELIPVDFAGFDRIQRAALDLGAYEQGKSLLEIWRQNYFGASDNAGDGADLNDFDHDGIPNLLEFAFSLDPKQNSPGQIPQPQRSGDNFIIMFIQPATVSGITYRAEWSTTLLPGSWTSIPNSSTPPQHAFSVPMESKTSLYMRLKVSAP